MNIQIAHIKHESAAEIMASAAAVRRRLFAPAVGRKPDAYLTRGRPQQVAQDQQWRKLKSRFDAHVTEWQLMKFGMVAKARRHIVTRCAELGASYEDVVSKSRRKDIIAVKHQLMFEVWQKFSPSYPALGRVFGGMDHTSALHAVRKIANRQGASTTKGAPIWPFDPAAVKRDFDALMSVREIAAKHNTTRHHVERFIKVKKLRRDNATVMSIAVTKAMGGA